MGVLTNHLSAEQLLIDQIKARVPEFKAVLDAGDLEDVEEQAQIVPACHVLYGGDYPGQTAGRGTATRIDQHWQLFICVKNAKTAKTARQEAGALITKVIEALSGWTPSINHGPVTLVPTGQPAGYSAGFAYFPLRFSTEVVTKGTQATP